MKHLLFFLFIFTASHSILGQNETARIEVIRENLEKLAASDPDILNEVDIQVSNDSIQSFITILVKTAKINVSLDPEVTGDISNHFTDVQAIDVLLYLCRTYNLNAKVIGNIIYLSKIKKDKKESDIPEIELNDYTSKLTLNLENDPLYKVVKTLSKVSGENIILDSKINKQLPITLYLQNIEADEAIRTLAYTLNFEVEKDKAYHYSLPKQKNKKQLIPNEQQIQEKNQTKSSLKEKKLPPTSFEYTVDDIGKRISVHAVNTPLKDLFTVLTQKTAENFVLMTEFSNKDKVTIKADNLTYQEYLSYILKGKDYLYHYSDGVYSIGKTEPDLFSQKMFQFEKRSFKEVSDALPTNLLSDIEIKEFKELNSLLINGKKASVDRLIKTLEDLDRVVPQVHMEVIVVDVSKSIGLDTGIKAGLNPKDSITNTGGQVYPNTNGYFNLNSKTINNLIGTINQAGLLNLGKVAPNFYVQLKASETNGNSKVHSTNRLSALNGHEASFAIGEKIFYYVQNDLATPTIGNGNVSVYTTRQLQSVEANFGVKITPYVAGDGQVTLEVDVDFSNFTGSPPQNATQPPPAISSQKFNSLIRVRDRDMVVLGGLEQESKTENTQGVPFLSRVPIIKWFTSDKQKSKRKSSLLIFIRPTIIY